MTGDRNRNSKALDGSRGQSAVGQGRPEGVGLDGANKGSATAVQQPKEPSGTGQAKPKPVADRGSREAQLQEGAARHRSMSEGGPALQHGKLSTESSMESSGVPATLVRVLGPG